jgi:hypothetical protein
MLPLFIYVSSVWLKFNRSGIAEHLVSKYVRSYKEDVGAVLQTAIRAK